MHRVVVSIALGVALAVASVPAFADPPSLTPLTPLTQPEPEPATVTVTDSYRSKTLTADGLVLGAALLGAELEGANGRDTAASNTLYPLALLGGVFATPIIHGLHGHGGRAIASYLLRATAIGAGAVIGVASASCTPHDFLCGLDRIGPGMLGGFIVAATIDAAFMTNETHEEPVHGATWAPIVAPRQGGATAGFAMVF
ncbi:MAG: hypothetical protein ABI467_26945 [Kofleriaceae bacterium]